MVPRFPAVIVLLLLLFFFAPSPAVHPLSASATHGGAAVNQSVSANLPLAPGQYNSTNSTDMITFSLRLLNSSGASPYGTALVVDEYSYSYSQLPLSFTWETYSTHSFSWSGTLSAGNGSRYAWESGSGPSTVQSGNLIVPYGGGYVIAYYEPQYLLTMKEEAGGTSSPPAGSQWVNSGSSVSISANPAAGYDFASWNGSGPGSYSGSDNPAHVIMEGPVSESPLFLRPFDFALSVSPSRLSLLQGGSVNATVNIYSSSGSNGSAISLSATDLPAGVNATFVPASARPDFESVLSLSASESASTGTFQVLVEGVGGNRTHSAVLSLTVAPRKAYLSAVFGEVGLPDGTSWSISVDGRSLTSTGQSLMVSNLTDGVHHWSVASVSDSPGRRYLALSPSGLFNLTSGMAPVRVIFTAQYLVGIEAVPSSDGHVAPGPGWFNPSQPLSISAVPRPGFAFAGWNASSALISVVAPSLNGTTAVVSGPGNITAYFKPLSPPPYVLAFAEQGLPNGTIWSVTVGNASLSSSDGTIVFHVPRGFYNYSVAPLANFTSAPARGVLSMTGSGLELRVAFIPIFFGTGSPGDHERLTNATLYRASTENESEISRAAQDKTIAATVSVDSSGENATSVAPQFSLSVGRVQSGILVTVSAVNVTGPRVILLNISRGSFLNFTGGISVLLDGAPIAEASSLNSVLSSTSGAGSFVVIATSSGFQLLVSIPHFSTHTIQVLSAASSTFVVTSTSAGPTVASTSSTTRSASTSASSPPSSSSPVLNQVLLAAAGVATVVVVITAAVLLRRRVLFGGRRQAG